MLAAFAAEPVVTSAFAEASSALGYDLWSIVQNGPESRLNSTDCTQPAMLAAGIATWRLWRERGGGAPAVVAGHSLGEFTALVVAGALEFGAAVELVQLRGCLMQRAVPAGEGAVAAILGLSDDEVAAACAEAAQGEVVEPANYNSPAQVVIAGAKAAVERAIEAAKGRGAKRAVLLPVSVPVHSSLMRPAAEEFAEALKGVKITPPGIDYISSVDAQAYADAESIRELLGRQLASPVRWTDTVRALSVYHIGQIIECGPGKVLTGLNRRSERRADTLVLSLDDPESMERVRTATLAAHV